MPRILIARMFSCFWCTIDAKQSESMRNFWQKQQHTSQRGLKLLRIACMEEKTRYWGGGALVERYWVGMLDAALDAFSGLVMALFQMKDGCCCIISDEGWLARMAGAIVLCYCSNPSSFFPPLPPPPPFLLLLKSEILNLYSSTSGLIEEKTFLSNSFPWQTPICTVYPRQTWKWKFLAIAEEFSFPPREISPMCGEWNMPDLSNSHQI